MLDYTYGFAKVLWHLLKLSLRSETGGRALVGSYPVAACAGAATSTQPSDGRPPPRTTAAAMRRDR